MAEDAKGGSRRGSNTRHVKHEVRRKIILDAAICCFEKNGPSTTIDEIAAAANITRRTIYHYFKSKTDIWRSATIQHACDQLLCMRAEVEQEQSFPAYVTECTLYMIESLPKQAFHKLQTSDGLGLKIGHVYFTSTEVKTTWIDTFQPHYISALRARSINPDLTLDDIIAWSGRVILSYVQYPDSGQDQEDIRNNISLFFTNALRYGA